MFEIKKFEVGFIVKGCLYMDTLGSIWEAKKSFKSRSSPISGAYWSLWLSASTRNTIQPHLENINQAILGEIKTLENMIARVKLVRGQVPPTLPTVPTPTVPIETVNMLDFGVVVGDGVDNSSALLSMRTQLAGNYNVHYNIQVPPGVLAYSDNRWLANMVRCTLLGDGLSTWKTIYSGTEEIKQRAFNCGDIFTRDLFTPYSGTGPIYCDMHKFASAVAGTRTINCADAAFYAPHVGKRVFLFGRDVVLKDYPPGCRVHEWHVIESVDTTANTITFVEPLKFNWNDKWPWSQGAFGERQSGMPQIVLLDRDTYIYPYHMEFIGITFQRSDVGAVDRSASFQGIGEYVVAKNCNIYGHLWPAMTKRLIIDNVHVFDTGYNICELDKLCDEVEFLNSTIDVHMNNGTGLRSVKIRNTHLADGAAVCCAELDIQDSTINAGTRRDKFLPALSHAPAGCFIRKTTLKNINFTRSVGNESESALSINTTGGYTAEVVEGNNLIILAGYTDESTGGRLIRHIEENLTVMFNETGTKRGKVTSLSLRENGDVVVSGDWPVGFIVGEVIKWFNIGVYSDLGGHSFSAFPVPYSGRTGDKLIPIHAEKIWACYRNVKDLVITGPCYVAMDNYVQLFYSTTQGGTVSVNQWVKRLIVFIPAGSPLGTHVNITYND